MCIKKWAKSVKKKLINVLRYLPIINDISLSGTTLYTHGALLLYTKIKCKGIGNSIEIMPGCELRNCNIYIRGNSNRIQIESDVHAVNAEIWIEDDGNSVVIGEKTNMCGRIHLACIEGTEIEVGKQCLCSSDIVIRTGDSHSILDKNSNRINKSKSVKIGDHVWLGHRVVLNKGVKIGSNTVVGAGSIVTKSFDEDGVVLAGVPASIVKTDINWDYERLV